MRSELLAESGVFDARVLKITGGEDAPIAAPQGLALINPATWATVDAPVREWALDHWIPARQATYLTGAGSAGKSLIAQQLCTCIAYAAPFMGIEPRQAVAIYLTCEDDADELHRRQKAICSALNVPIAALGGRLHLISLAGMIGNELALFDPLGRMTATQQYADLLAAVRATGAGFVALDNVAHLFSGNENIRNQVAAFCGLLNNLAADTGAAVLFIGHPNKAGDNFSGSTAWENQVRSRLFLETPRDANGATIDSDARTLTRAKANYARNGEALAFRWHQWAFVRDDDLPRHERAEVAANVQIGLENERFLACLATTTAQGRNLSHVSCATGAIDVFPKLPEALGMNKAAFRRAQERLISLGIIRVNQPFGQTPNRKPLSGIKLASECATPPAPVPRADPRQPLAEVIDIACADPCATHPLYTTYKSGAALRADAPDTDSGKVE